MKKLLLIGFVLFLSSFLFGCGFLEPESVNVNYKAKIIAVVDGDTIKIRFDDLTPVGCERTEIVRLIGVNTPELKGNEYYAQEARAFTNRYWNSECEVEFDDVSAMRDKYGRLLAYVFISTFCLNEKLIYEGYGYYYDVFNFNVGRMQMFRLAEDSAKTNKRGLWN